VTIEAVTNQEIRDKLKKMLSVVWDTPLQVRILSPKIRDVDLVGDTVFSLLRRLTRERDVQITLIINPEWMVEEGDKEFLKKLDEIGVKIHSNTNLHAKMILVENMTHKIALIGSANYTKGGTNGNDEASIFLINQDPHVYDKLYEYVTRMLRRINEYGVGGDTTPRPEQLVKTIEKLGNKVEKLKLELAALGR
jgi:phosphatidylserine/phosphatidylglycerophosphate/cardiolipin synthase-like enzyme